MNCETFPLAVADFLLRARIIKSNAYHMWGHWTVDSFEATRVSVIFLGLYLVQGLPQRTQYERQERDGEGEEEKKENVRKATNNNREKNHAGKRGSPLP